MRIKSKFITGPGLIATPIRETATRVRVKIIGSFFPTHVTRWGMSRVEPASRRRYLHDCFIGREITFWKTGTRAGFEVGGDLEVEQW